MRLDKWLKVSLIFKQRSSAVSAIDNNRIRVNGEIAKASKTIKIGDVVSVNRELGEYRYTILSLMEKNVSRAEARNMYDLVAPEDTGSDDEKFLKNLEKKYRKESKKDWNKMHDDKKKQRQVRTQKYQDY